MDEKTRDVIAVSGLIIQGVQLLAVGLAGVSISRSQLKLAKLKARQDAYDRRLKIFTMFRDALSGITRKGVAGTEDLDGLAKCRQEAVFLFGGDVTSYLSEVFDRAHDQGELNQRLLDPNQTVDIPASMLKSYA